MFRGKKVAWVGFSLFFFYFLPTEKAIAHEGARQIETSISTVWKNRYVSEGRNNLNNGGIITFEGNGEFLALTLGAWYGVGDREDYQELNLYAEYGVSFGDLEASLNYTRLIFLETDEYDHELGAELKYQGMIFNPGIKYYYSTESQGGFFEVYLHAVLKRMEDRLILKPYVLEGFDFGYATREHDGPNHIQLGLETSFLLSEPVSLVATVGYSLAGKDVRREHLGNVSWVSAGLLVEF